MIALLKDLAKKAIRLLLGNYEIYRLFALDLGSTLNDPRAELTQEGLTAGEVTTEQVASARSEAIRDTAWYGGPGARGFAILHEGEIVALEWYWSGEERKDQVFWPLAADEAESAYIVTATEMRGRKLAQRVKQYAAIRMHELGFRRSYGKIWFTHDASIGANLKSGFREVALVIDLYPFGGKRRRRFVRWRSAV